MTTSSEDLGAALRDHHERIEQMMATVKTTSGDDRRAVFRRLRRFLAAHEAAERIFIHLLVEHDPVQDDIAERRVREEDEAGEVLAELEDIDVDSGEFDRIFDQLSHSVSKHARAEELQELPAVIEQCRSADIDRIRLALEHVDVVVSHRGGPLGEGDRSFAQLLEAAKVEFRALRNDLDG